MEELYWKHFTETGSVIDYLGYKMEKYGHIDFGERAYSVDMQDSKIRGCVHEAIRNEENRSNSVESNRIDRDGAFDNTSWRI